MKTQGAFVVVCNKEQGILLVKRKDVPLWDLPGGRAEQDETVEECAIRETYEETGYIIDISYKSTKDRNFMMCSIFSTAGLRAAKH